MTRALRIAFYCEGNTDSRVIPIFIEKILSDVQLIEDVGLTIDSQKWNGRGTFIEVCISLIHQSRTIHQLIVFHTDADGPNTKEVYRVKIDPLISAIKDHSIDDFPIVWAIPVYAVEAWLIVSPQAFARALTKNDQRHGELEFPRHSYQIHSDKAKHIFSESVLLLLARTKRQERRIVPAQYYEDVANEISTNDLRRLPAFVEFERSLISVLTELGYIA